jgi:thiamine phosphate synthase YjbQ (UPF0047 family)
MKWTFKSAFEATHEVGSEVLQSIKNVKVGKGTVLVSTPAAAREATVNDMKAEYDLSKMKSRRNPYGYYGYVRLWGQFSHFSYRCRRRSP